MKKIKNILLQAIPVLIMIGLIPFISNDYLLTFIYIAIIFASFRYMRAPHDFLIFIFGFFVMIVSEYLFVKTGVEIFIRDAFFGFIPLWLPFLWGYAFVAMKRSIEIIESR